MTSNLPKFDWKLKIVNQDVDTIYKSFIELRSRLYYGKYGSTESIAGLLLNNKTCNFDSKFGIKMVI